jgi:putative tryptophan/tyrosine transport system substrate-binding protein
MMRRPIGVILTLGFLLPLIIAKAQPGTKIPSVAVLSPADATALSDPKRGLYAFRQGLRELGYVEGQSIYLEYRVAEW